MMLSEVRVGDGVRQGDVLFMKTPPLEFFAPVSSDPVLGRRLIRGSAFECISRLAIFSLALVLAAGAWSCSSEPPMHGALGTPHVIGMPGQVPVSPTATPTAMPTPSQ